MSAAHTAADLKGFSLLSELGEDDREALFDLLEPKHFPKGRSIYRETAEADGMLFLASGVVSLSVARGADLGTLSAGSALGGASLLSAGRREATAKAETDCEVLILARTAYRRLLDDYPRTGARLTEAIGAQLAGLLREAVAEKIPAARLLES